jgi:carboxypeptidase C (cathepsin A)
MFKPVEFWDSANSTVSQINQHMLTAYFYNQPKVDLKKSFTLADQGGPGVIVLQVAMVNASAVTPGSR